MTTPAYLDVRCPLCLHGIGKPCRGKATHQERVAKSNARAHRNGMAPR